MNCNKCGDPQWLHTKLGCLVIKKHDGKDIKTGKRCPCRLTGEQVSKQKPKK